MMASVSGSPCKRPPRVRQPNTSAAGGGPLSCWASSSITKSSQAASESRKWKRTVDPTRGGVPHTNCPFSGRTPKSSRTRKSPRPSGRLCSSIAMPSSKPSLTHSRRSSGSPNSTSLRTASTGRFPNEVMASLVTSVTTCRSPTGTTPGHTKPSTTTLPCRWAATNPPSSTSPSATKTLCPGWLAPLATPPQRPGKSSGKLSTMRWIGSEKGSAKAMEAAPAGCSPIMSATPWGSCVGTPLHGGTAVVRTDTSGRVRQIAERPGSASMVWSLAVTASVVVPSQWAALVASASVLHISPNIVRWW